MAIIVTKNGKDAHRISKSSFTYETNLQNFIHENPDTIPLYDIDEDIRLLILAREVPTNSGSIDAIGTDESGEAYIVETKLYKNPDKRLVVAQILDYGASISGNPDRLEDFKQAIEDKIFTHFNLPFNDKLSQFFELSKEDSQSLIDRFHQNLFDGKFRFVVLMDGIEQRLKDLISFLNRNSSFDLYGVELEFYKYEDYEITIPKLFGAEVKKDVNILSGSNNRRKWDQETFFNEVHNKLHEKEESQIKELFDFFVDHADHISWGSGIKRGSFSPIFNKISPKSLLSIYTDGQIQINYAWLTQNEEQIQYKLRYRELLSKLINIPPEDGSFRYPNIPLKKWGSMIPQLKDLYLQLMND